MRPMRSANLMTNQSTQGGVGELGRGIGNMIIRNGVHVLDSRRCHRHLAVVKHQHNILLLKDSLILVYFYGCYVPTGPVWLCVCVCVPGQLEQAAAVAAAGGAAGTAAVTWRASICIGS